MFSVKPGVELTEVHPAMVAAWPTIMQVYRQHGYDTTLTSGRDGNHMQGSYHYTVPMQANDFRTWADSSGRQMRWAQKLALAEDLRQALGPDYDVVPERTHMHIEYDPK